MIRRILLAAAIMLPVTAMAPGALAQSATDVRALAAMGDKQLMKLPAKKVFGGQKGPTTSMKARAIGSYAKGCMAGGTALAVDGPAWQVMRLSRNRNWGHPDLVALVERLAKESKAKDGWNGLLVGDLAQPRGGPMLSGHASHQVGLDADVWLTPMPDRTLTRKEREEIQATVVVKDRKTMDYSVWTEAHAKLIRRAASYPEVARIFVHPPIKAELCKWAKGDRAWLAKVRPYYGHNYHFHIRISCPEGSPSCKNQPTPSPKDGTGCGEELAYWMGKVPWKQAEKPKPDTKPAKPAPPLTLAALPAECRAVVTAE
ncbi:penicillin-insensitive murein endopeptidase [Aestuariivirga sp.]|uniref:penicillin-insensitive murein endopeptidase n=1 Tax=Aestuariivirga sp. TaxID=2650926 RepID=UPI003919448A